MIHFLENTYQEIQNTQSRIDTLESRRYFLFFSSSFKKQYKKYAALKKVFLLNYSSLFSDIKQDSNTENIVLVEIDNVKNSIIYITDTIESCMKIFITLKSSSQNEENIMRIEKDFLTTSISSFRKDLEIWIQNHSKELSGEITKLQEVQSIASQINHTSILELQVKRLELQIQNLSNIIK
jgi:hypothetical protein